MSIFYERIESEDKIVITYKFHLLFYVVFAVVLLFLGLSYVYPALEAYNTVVFVLAMVFFLAYFVDVWKLRPEVQGAVRAGKAKVSGNKFSITDPLRIEISK